MLLFWKRESPGRVFLLVNPRVFLALFFLFIFYFLEFEP